MLDGILGDYTTRIAGMQRAEIAIDVDDDSMSAQAALFPPPTGDVRAWVDSIEGGPTAPLAASSRGALATLFWRAGSDERERAAKSAGDALIRSLGTRLPAIDEAKLGDYLTQIARARAGWAMISLTAGSTPGVLARLATNDAPKITTAIEGMLDLTKKPAWEKWEKDSGITKIERGPAQAMFTTTQGPFQTGWVVRGGEVDIAAAIDAPGLLASVSSEPPLSSDAKVSAWLRELRANVLWAVVGRPLLTATSPRSDPMVVALSRDRDHVVLHARATGVLVRQLVVSSKGL
jgi:hypothetical protein